MEEDFQSFIVDPDLVDQSIDVSGLKTQTSTRPELLFDLPEFSGIKVDPTRDRYIQNMYEAYGGGLPMLPEPVVEDTAQIPGAVDTLVDVGGGGGQDQVTGGSVLDTTPQDFGQNLVDQGIGIQATPTDPVVAPGEMPLTQDDFDAFNEIAVTPQTFANTGRADLLDQAGNVPGVGFATDFFPDIDTNVETVLGKPGIERFDDAETSIDMFEDTTPNVAFDRPTIADVAGPVTLSQQNVIGTDANVGFEDIPTLEAEDVDTQGNLLDTGLEKVKSVFPDFDPLITAGKLALNTFVGKPVSLVIDALQALPSEDPADTLNRDIVDELKKEKDYGFNIQSGNLNQDPFGRNPVSLLGNYEQTLLDDANSTGTTKMALAKKEFAQDYFDKKAGKTAPQEDIGAVSEDITTGADLTTGDLPGGGNIADEFGSDGDTGRTTGPTVSRSDPDFGQFGRQQSATAAGGGSSSGGGKIVCTMMNESYGFGSFRNKIWLRHSKNLAPEYQKGYHKIFLPLVKLSKNNKVLKTILEHIAVHRTIDIRQESRGKVHLLGRVYRKILEPICYWVGKHG